MFYGNNDCFTAGQTIVIRVSYISFNPAAVIEIYNANISILFPLQYGAYCFKERKIFGTFFVREFKLWSSAYCRTQELFWS